MLTTGERNTVKFILVSHGDFAEGLLSAITMLLGPQKDILAFGLYPHESPDALLERVEAALEPEDEGNAVFFSDFYFGSPFNVVNRLSERHDLQHITGVNLPTMLEAVLTRNGGDDIRAVCANAMTASEGSVKDVRKLVESHKGEGDEEEL